MLPTFNFIKLKISPLIVLFYSVEQMSNVYEFLEGIRHLLEAAIVGEPVMITGGRFPDCLASPVNLGTVTSRRLQPTPPPQPPGSVVS